MAEGDSTLRELPADHGPTFDQDAASAAQGGIVCALHKSHSPETLTIEYHHVIPVAWQVFYQPPEPWPFPGYDPRSPLWDARTMPLCPTGHRNVHYLIAAMMKSPHGIDPEETRKAIAGHAGHTFDVAYEALTRFTEAGGSIATLAAAREWGQA